MTALRVFFCSTLLFMLIACGGASPPANPPKAAASGISLPAPSIKFLTIEPAGNDGGAMQASFPARVSFRPQALANVGAPLTGRITSISVRPGQTVNAGDPLLALQSADAASARAALEQATARAAAAEDLLRRHGEMVAKGVGVEAERFEVETKAREARSELERARRSAALVGSGTGEQVVLRAPAAGLVLSVRAAVGAFVAPGGDALVEIADPKGLWIVADVPEVDANVVARGRAVRVRIPGVDASFDGTVDGIGSRVDGESRRLPIYVALKGKPGGLVPGMLAEVSLVAPAGAPGILTLPVTAVLIKDGGRRIVYVQRPDGAFESRTVRVGPSGGGRVPIIEGLKPGERVVVRGALLLDGEAEQLL